MHYSFPIGFVILQHLADSTETTLFDHKGYKHTFAQSCKLSFQVPFILFYGTMFFHPFTNKNFIYTMTTDTSTSSQIRYRNSFQCLYFTQRKRNIFLQKLFSNDKLSYRCYFKFTKQKNPRSVNMYDELAILFFGLFFRVLLTGIFFYSALTSSINLWEVF